MLPLNGHGEGKEMDKLFDSPWVLRITALALSVLLFFYVQSLITDKNQSNTTTQADILTNVPLEVYYDDDNLIVSGLPETVDVKIEGPMQVVLQTKILKDYKVFVDLNSLFIGEHSVTIQTENFSEKLNVSVDPGTLKILIEELVTQEFKVEPEINSRQIAEDFVLDGTTASPSRVLISGAKSIIDSINYVKASVKMDDSIRESFEQESNVIVLNKDLSKLDVSIDPQKVKVRVNVKAYTKEIPLQLETIGELNENITLNSLTLAQEKITVTGAKSIVDALTDIKVQINLEELQTSGSYEGIIGLAEGIKAMSQKPVLVEADVTAANEADEQSSDLENNGGN